MAPGVCAGFRAAAIRLHRMSTGQWRYRPGMDVSPEMTCRRSPVRITTLGECLRARHGVSAYCVRCRRWARLDLDHLVALGYGDRALATCRPRCHACRGPGLIQLRAPVPDWQGPASHGGARRIGA